MTASAAATDGRPDGRLQEPKYTANPDDTLSASLEKYSFPRRKLRTTLSDPSRTPLVLVACGSFSPPTYLHLRMFEIAADYVRDNTRFEVVGGYFSPVNSNYKKEGLVGADARTQMCWLATRGHDWLSVDEWEGLAPSYVPTAEVLDHFDNELKNIGGVETESGEKKAVRVALLAGADLISTFATPGLWSKTDLDHILGMIIAKGLAIGANVQIGNYGCFILERAGVDIDEHLENLGKWMSNLWFINQPIQNDVSNLKALIYQANFASRSPVQRSGCS